MSDSNLNFYSKTKSSCMCTYRGLLTVSTLYHTLMFPSSYVDKLLTNTADH